MMYLEVTGRLGADSELRKTKNGKDFVSMRVASNDYIYGENVTTWINVIFSGDRALKMQEHLKKGSSVILRGIPRVSMYTAKDGEKTYSIDVLADRVDFLNSGSSNGGNSQTNSNGEVTNDTNVQVQQNSTPQPIPQVVTSSNDNDDNDDLPF